MKQVNEVGADVDSRELVCAMQCAGNGLDPRPYESGTSGCRGRAGRLGIRGRNGLSIACPPLAV
jgi:hypothetical protein